MLARITTQRLWDITRQDRRPPDRATLTPTRSSSPVGSLFTRRPFSHNGVKTSTHRNSIFFPLSREFLVTKDEKNVFISHVHADDSGVGNLKDLLTQHGLEARNYSITSDKFNQAKDEHYIKTEILGPRIRQCSVLIVYISPETKRSEYVNWEIEYAHKEGKRIVGVWAHGDSQCDVPDALDKYADAVRRMAGEQHPRRHRRPDKRLDPTRRYN